MLLISSVKKVSIEMFDITAKNFDDAWFKVNQKFLGADGDRPEDACRAMMCYSFNNLIMINSRPKITLDPGMILGYKKQKWSGLLRTYMDWEQYDYLYKSFHTRFKKSGDHSIPLGYSFKPSHKMNGSCLIGLTFLVDKNKNKVSVNIHTRVAEVTRRMMFDYILFYKFFKRLFKGTPVWDMYEWDMKLFYQMSYQSAMFVPVLHTTFDFAKMGISTTGRQKSGFIGRIERELEVCMKKESRGSGFAQMAAIRAMIAADMNGVPRKSVTIKSFTFAPGGKKL